jgi:two-component system CheB/CheR fusion protein
VNRIDRASSSCASWICWRDRLPITSNANKCEEEREQLLAREHGLRQTAEDANRLKDEFLAIMSHELRNPLNVILGYAELLLRTEEIKKSDNLHRMADAVKRNAVAQSKLIRDLLDLSRLRSGKLELNRETCFARHFDRKRD